MACAGANNKALAFFGLEWMTKNSWRGGLKCEGVPVITSPTSEEIGENQHLISSLMPRGQNQPPRRLVMAFDRTYLQTCSSFAMTNRGHVLCGGPHRCAGFDLEDESQVVLKDPAGTVHERTVKKDREKATEVEAFVMWDPTRQHSPFLEVAAFPVTAQADKHSFFEEKSTNVKSQRGQWEAAHRLGLVMEQCHSVKILLADRHGSHRLIANWIFGRPVPLPAVLRKLVPWFRDLHFAELPRLGWSLPYRVCMVGGSETSVHYLPGPAHAQKNFVEQMRSALGTPAFGKFWVDMSAALELGLWPIAFSGTDTMSDKQAALWCLRCMCFSYLFFHFLALPSSSRSQVFIFLRSNDF